MRDRKELFLASIHYLSQSDRDEVARGVASAEEFHRGQQRESGEPYFFHPLAVAAKLAHLEAGRDMLIAALLHDVIEDDRADFQTVQSEFGENVAKLVDGVTKLTKVRYEGDPSLRQVASLRKMLLTASQDVRVIIIKIADRLHNIETIGSLRPDKQQRIARETLDIYVPFARMTGLWNWKRQLEENCFPIAFPLESKIWKEAIEVAREGLRTERREFVKRFDSVTSKRVQPELVFMTDYELYQRLYGDLKRLDETSQIDSVRVIVRDDATPIDCYQVLGEVHVRYPVHALTFRDFINAPQPSGYRGLHTTIFLSRKHELRLRIQTQEMFDFAERRKISAWVDDKNSDIYTALSALGKAVFDRQQYITDLKTAVLERMNVFTTAGEIITLPRGATGVDFAFMVNPDYLFSLNGVRVNGEVKEATYELHDGDTVEMVLYESGSGSAERRVMWVEKVKSLEARDSLRQSLEGQGQEDQKSAGKLLLKHEGIKWRLPLWWMFLPGIQQRVASTLNEKTFDSVLEKVGAGSLAAGAVITVYKDMLKMPNIGQKMLQFLHLLPRSRVLDKQAALIDIDVYAVDQPGMIYAISKCFAERRINISQFAAYAVPPSDALYKIRLEANDMKQFSELYDAILQSPGIKGIRRRK